MSETTATKEPEWKRPAYTGTVHHGCLNCGGTETIAPMDMLIGVGFGSASITCDGKPIFDEMEHMHSGKDIDELPTLAQFEEMAKADPDHDWIADLQGPLRGRTYQRHGDDKWVLIDSNQGFA